MMKGKEELEHRLVEVIIIIAGNYPKKSTRKWKALVQKKNKLTKINLTFQLDLPVTKYSVNLSNQNFPFKKLWKEINH